MWIYKVSSDHEFSCVYFEDIEDAEHYAGQCGAASGMEVYKVYVVEGMTLAPREGRQV